METPVYRSGTAPGSLQRTRGGSGSRQLPTEAVTRQRRCFFLRVWPRQQHIRSVCRAGHRFLPPDLCKPHTAPGNHSLRSDFTPVLRLTSTVTTLDLVRPEVERSRPEVVRSRVVLLRQHPARRSPTAQSNTDAREQSRGRNRPQSNPRLRKLP